MKIIKMTIGMAITLVCMGGMYIAGHTAAMHRHASQNEINKMMLDDNDSLNKVSYIKKAILDFKEMIDDPLGLDRELD